MLTGPDGSGRTALLRAVVDEARRAHPHARILEAAGESGARQRAFGLLRELLRPPQTGADGATLLEHLDQDVGALAAPQLWADALRILWLAQLEDWAGSGPLVFVIDDADAADLVSLRYLARAAAHLRDRALFLVLATRPGAPETELRASLVGGGVVDLEVLAVPPLRRGSLAHLARRWAPSSTEQARRGLLERAEGLPGRLRVLVRAACEGLEGVDGSAAELLLARLERLDPDSRRLLRAASVFEASFTSAYVAALLGGGVLPEEVEARLGDLETQSHVRRAGQISEGAPTRWIFEDALTRAAFHGRLTPDDLTLGHRAAAEVLANAEGADPARVAAHLVAGG